MGFEPEAIKKAVDSLYEAETSSAKDRQKAAKNVTITSSKFPPGTEYSLTYAESHLMGAISLFLSESVLDSAKALLKLRKAYQALDELNKLMNNSSQMKRARSRANSTATLVTLSSLSRSSTRLSTNEDDDGSEAAPTPLSESMDNLKVNTGKPIRQRSNSSLLRDAQTPSSSSTSFSSSSGKPAAGKTSSQYEALRKKVDKFYEARAERLKLVHNFSPEILTDNASQENPDEVPGHETVDEFLTSGINCMFGLLQLVISIIPPTLGKVLSIVGFKGDREEGLRMLWEASRSVNIHGAIAMLALLQYFDGPTQFSDIRFPEMEKEMEETGDVATPAKLDPAHVKMLENAKEFEADILETRQKLKKGLETIRTHYSIGALWQLQEGRMVSSNTGDLARAVAIMDDRSNGPIQMKQVDGLMMFDKTMLLLALHEYEKSAQNYIELIDLSTWSHALYVYMSAACHLEIYRANKGKDEALAEKSKHKATKLFEKVPTMMGKRKFMAKAMPFDSFVVRKANAWKQLATKKGIDYVDAIGTSPLHEALYFWNGYARMPEKQLKESYESLGYSGEPGTPGASQSEVTIAESSDEACSRYLFQAMILRYMNRLEEAKEILDTKVLPNVWTPMPSKGVTPYGLPKPAYKHDLKEGWCGPSAIYERAVVEWRINGLSSLGKTKDYLQLASDWDKDYELSTRVSFKIKGARDRLDAFKA